MKVEPRAIIQSEMSDEDGAEMFYAKLLHPLPVGTKLTTVADMLAALRQPSAKMLEAAGQIPLQGTRGIHDRKCFLAMLDQFEKEQSE